MSKTYRLASTELLDEANYRVSGDLRVAVGETEILNGLEYIAITNSGGEIAYREGDPVGETFMLDLGMKTARSRIGTAWSSMNVVMDHCGL